MHLREIRAKKEAYCNTIRNILNRAETEKRALTPDEKKDYDGLMAKIEGLNDTLEAAHRLGEVRAELERPVEAGPVVPRQEGGMIYVPRSVRPGEIRAY